MTYTLSISLCRMMPPGEIDDDAAEDEIADHEHYCKQYDAVGQTHYRWHIRMLEVDQEDPRQSKVQTVQSPLFDPTDGVLKQEILRQALECVATAISRRASQAIQHQ